MTYTMTVTTETATGTTVKRYSVTADTVNDKRAEVRQSAPRGSTQTITVK
jgi:hypothetical protein